MPDLFWLHLALAFTAGNVWITLATLAADRLGGFDRMNLWILQQFF
jgi:hypothetical protein